MNTKNINKLSSSFQKANNSPAPNNGESPGGKPTTAALEAEVKEHIGRAQSPQDTKCSHDLKYKNHSPPTKIVNKGGEVGDGGLAEASLNLNNTNSENEK